MKTFTLLLLLLLLFPGLAHAAVTGTAEVLHADRITKGQRVSRFETYVRPDTGGRFLVASGTAPYRTDIQHGDRVLATQVVVRKSTTTGVAAAPTWRIEPLTQRKAAAAAPLVGGRHPTAFVPVSFPGRPSVLPAGLVQQIASFYAANSYGQLTLAIDVVPVTIPVRTDCNYRDIGAKADAAAKGALAPYLHKVYFFPALPCGFAGVSTVGGSPSLSWVNGNVSGMVTAHELGHGLGSYHSHALACGAEAIGTVGAGCAMIEYGDTLDVMGGGSLPTGHFNAAQKALMGWLTPELATAGTYTLPTLLTTPRALRIARGTGSDVFWLEHRPEGLIVHLATPSANGIAMLVMSPSNWAAPGLVLDRLWTDPVSQVSMRLDRYDATSAQVTVGTNVGPPPPPPPPPPPTADDVTRTFVRRTTTDTRVAIDLLPYRCVRLMGGTSAGRIVKVVNGKEQILGSTKVPRPAFNVLFTLRCQRFAPGATPATVALSLDGALLLTAAP